MTSYATFHADQVIEWCRLAKGRFEKQGDTSGDKAYIRTMLLLNMAHDPLASEKGSQLVTLSLEDYPEITAPF